MTATEDRNRAFYDQLYGNRSAVAHLVRAAISFDQRSKAAPNIAALDRILPVAAADGRQEPIRLLDYGCGWGTLLIGLRGRGLDLYGYDISDAAVPGVQRAAALLGERVREAPRDANGALERDFFDIVVCSHVLEHVADDLAMLSEFRRSLRGRGHLLLNVPINEVVADPKHARSYTRPAIRQRAEDAGFEVVWSRAVDQWTAYLLAAADNAGRLRRGGVRMLRGGLAVLPWSRADSIGRRLLNRTHRCQQYIVLCRARDS